MILIVKIPKIAKKYLSRSAQIYQSLEDWNLLLKTCTMFFFRYLCFKFPRKLRKLHYPRFPTSRYVIYFLLTFPPSPSIVSFIHCARYDIHLPLELHQLAKIIRANTLSHTHTYTHWQLIQFPNFSVWKQLQIFGFNSQLYNNFTDALQRAQGIVAVSLLLQVHA